MFAYKDMSLEQFDKVKHDFNLIEKDLTVLCMFGLRDILRSEVPESV